MNRLEREMLLRLITDECSKDPTLPSAIYAAVTNGLVAGFHAEIKKSSDLAYTLACIVDIAEKNKALKAALMRYKGVLKMGFIILRDKFASAPVQKKIEQYIEE